jgi:hypothetical protein
MTFRMNCLSDPPTYQELSRNPGHGMDLADVLGSNCLDYAALEEMEMVLKEYGVYCVNCKSFIRINSYEFDPPQKPAPTFLPAPNGETLSCKACEDVCVYRAVDIVHRFAS